MVSNHHLPLQTMAPDLFQASKRQVAELHILEVLLLELLQLQQPLPMPEAVHQQVLLHLRVEPHGAQALRALHQHLHRPAATKVERAQQLSLLSEATEAAEEVRRAQSCATARSDG